MPDYGGYNSGYRGGTTPTPVPASPAGTPEPLPAVWTFATGPWQGMPVAEIADGTARTATWRLIGNHEASVTISNPDAYEALGKALGPSQLTPPKAPPRTTIGVRIGYGNVQGAYKTSDTARMARIPAQVELIRGADMACDLFVAVELHEENNMHELFLSRLKEKDADWALCEGDGGNQLLLRPSLYTAKAKNMMMPGNRAMTDFTVTDRQTGYAFHVIATHFRADDTDGGDRDKEREQETQYLARYTAKMNDVLVAGDFNFKNDTIKRLRGILATSGLQGLQTRSPGLAGYDQDSYSGNKGSRWIDDIFTKPAQVVTAAAGVSATDASDHALWMRATVFFTDAPISSAVTSATPQLGEGGILELVWDLWVSFNGRPLFRGRFGPSSDTGDADGNLSTVLSAADYREMLQRRRLYEGDKVDFTNTDQADIAWSLLSSTQSKVGGNLGIVRGAGATTGVKRDRSTYQYGDSIGNAIDQLGQVANGFDWDIIPNALDTSMKLDLYYPSRGVDRRVVLDYGGRVQSFSRQVDPGTFGNAVRGTGASTLTPVRIESNGLAGDPAGRWDLQYADDTITVAKTLQDKTTKAVADGQYVQPSWTVVLTPGTWNGPDDFWLGDQVTLVVQTGRLDVVRSLRVLEMSVSIDENNVDTITVTLGAPDPKLRRTVRAINKRLTALERR